LTWELWSLTGDEDPAWPAWAACAGRHTIRMPSDRIRNIRQMCPFIQLPYAEKLHKYNLIAAATCHISSPGYEKRNNGCEEIIPVISMEMFIFDTS
jgi:hypothetical protein